MASPTPQDSSVLLRQNQDLRQRLQEEAGNYRRRLDTYKQAQQNQAALVGRLQSKVLQYKQKCNDLEGKIQDVLPITPRNTVNLQLIFIAITHALAVVRTYVMIFLNIYYQCVSSSQPGSSTTIPLPPPSNYSTTAPLSLPCPTSIEHSSQQPSRDYRSDDHDDLIRRLEDEKYRFV